MSDEEKEALEILNNTEWDGFMIIIKNLIEKQSKEIEELKEKNRQGKMRIVQLENEITARIEDVNQYYTPKDKIKAKIEELEKGNKNTFIRGEKILVLQSLLEKG